MITIQAVSSIEVSKASASVGREIAMGKLDSCTSMYAAVRANRDSLRSRVSRRAPIGANTLKQLHPYRVPSCPNVVDMPETRSRNTITANGEFRTNFSVVVSLHIASEDIRTTFAVLGSLFQWSHTTTRILRGPRLCSLR